MSMSSAAGRPPTPRSPLRLEFPQSLAIYDDYEAAQKTVDFLADEAFPVENCMIVGTDLKRIERITGRLSTSRVALGGVASGAWLGLFVGVIFALFTEESAVTTIVSTVLFGMLFGVIWALLGYAMTRGQRDFQSVTQVVATRYEVLVEHKVGSTGARTPGHVAGSAARPLRLSRCPAPQSWSRCCTITMASERPKPATIGPMIAHVSLSVMKLPSM